MAKAPLFPGWKVVIGSGIGIGSGSVPFFASSFALLAAAMAKDFGWGQPEVAKAASIYLLMQTIAYPLCGWPLDRWGSRIFACISIVLFAISLVVISGIGGSLWQLYAAFALMGLIAAGTNVVSYARAIALWFNRKRGLAMGLAASAQAIGAFGMPIATQRLVAAYGWSVTVLCFAAFEIIVCLPLVGLLIKDSPAPFGLAPDGDDAGASAAAPGHGKRDMTLSEVLGSASFWKLAVCFAVMGMSFYAIAPNIVYILTKKAGMSMADVAMVQAVTGIATLFGRIGFGFLLDRLHAPFIGIMALALTAICSATYAMTAVPALIIGASILSGLAIGGDTDLMPYLASRYFGTGAVSRIFGWFLFAFFLGAAIGPIAFAQLSAYFGSTDMPLMMLACIQIIPAILFLSLGRTAPVDALPSNAALGLSQR